KLLYFVVLGLICYSALTGFAARTPFQAAYGLLPVAFLSFLLIAAQAVTAITSERDTGSLDLLLVTDLSPREFIFGKLLGITYNTWPFLLPPIALALVYGHYYLLATPPADYPELAPSYNVEATLCVAGSALVLLA